MGKTLAVEIKQFVTANAQKPSVIRVLHTLFNRNSKAFCSFFERLFSTSGIVFSSTSKRSLWTAIKHHDPQEKSMSQNAKYRNNALGVRVFFTEQQTSILYEICSLIECVCLAFFDESTRFFAKNILDIPRAFAAAFLFCAENSAREWMLANWLDSAAAADSAFWRDSLRHQFVHSEYFLELLYRDSNETQAPLLAATGKMLDSQRFVVAAWLFYLYRLSEKTNKFAVTVDCTRAFVAQAQQNKKRGVKNRAKPNWTMSERRVNETLDELTELFSICLSMLYGHSLLAIESTLARYDQKLVNSIADVAEEIRVFLMRQSSGGSANPLLRSLYDRVFDYRQPKSSDEMSLFKTEELSLDELAYSLFNTGQSIELARLAQWLQAMGFADVRLDYLIRYNATHEALLEPLIQSWCDHIGVWRLSEQCYVSALRQAINTMVALPQYASLSADAYFVGGSRSLGTFVISSRRRMEALRSCMLNHRLRNSVHLHTALHERTQRKDTVLYPLIVRSFFSAMKSDSTQESLLAVTKNTVDFLCVMMGIRRVRGRQRHVEELSEAAELSLFKFADRLVHLCARGYQLRASSSSAEIPMWLLEQVMRAFLLVREEHCISLGAVWEMHALFRQNARWRERFPQMCQLMEILLENCEGWKRDVDPLLETNTAVEPEDTLFDRLKRKMVNEEVRRQRQRADTVVPMDAATRRVIIKLNWDDLFRSKTKEINKRYALSGSGSAAASSSAGADDDSDDIASSADEPTPFSPLFEKVRRSKRARQAEVNRLIYEFFLHALDDEIDYRDGELVKVLYNCLQDFELRKEKIPSDLLEVNRPSFETTGVVPLVWPSPQACNSFTDSFLANCTPHYDSASGEQMSNARLKAFTLFLRALETSATARFCASESDPMADDLSLLQQYPAPVSYDSSLWLAATTPSTVDGNIFGSESAYCVNSVLRLADGVDDFLCYGKGELGFLSFRDFATHRNAISY